MIEILKSLVQELKAISKAYVDVIWEILKKI